MLHEFANVIIEKAFKMTYRQEEYYNDECHLVSQDSDLNLEKVKEILDLSDSDIEIVGYLDRTEGEQQEERYFAQNILDNVDTDMNLISLKIFFENDTPYQEFYHYLLIQKL